MADARPIDHDRLATLWDVIDYHRQRTPDAIALQFERRQTSYAALFDGASALARRLVASGAGRGDRIGYLGKNSDRYFVLLYAVARIGAVLVPLNWRLAPDEWAFIARDAEMTLLFADEAFLGQAGELAGAVGLEPPNLIVADGDAAEIACAMPLPDEVIFQVYTSGTTGRPKGAMLTHRNMLALRSPGYRAGLRWFPGHRDSSLVILPIAHVAGTAYALFGLYGGGRVVIAREFDPALAIELLATEAISHVLLAPSAMQQMLDHPAVTQADLHALGFITYGASPMPEALLARAMATFGCGFVQMYGMTEAAGGVVALSPEDHAAGDPVRLRSAGRAMPGVEIAILDDGRASLAADRIGEIVVRSAAVMEGYWRRPQATAETIRADGWMRTGDIGRIDGDGYLFVLDRAKDMIVSGGENIYPAEVENAIFGHPDVADVAVIGVPSARWGEEVLAIIVPRDGHVPELASIAAWARARIAAFKVPKRIALTDALPRNAGNKVLRRMLREPYWEGHERRVN